MDCIIKDIHGDYMVRYKGINYCLVTTLEDAKNEITDNNPISMHKDFTIIYWK
jgi:hypothetical protein